MPRTRWMFRVLLCLWPGLALGQTQSDISEDKQPSVQYATPCVNKEAAREVLRLGRTLGYREDEIVEAYGQDPCATLAHLRGEVQEKAQSNFTAQTTSTQKALKTGLVKCQIGATGVSVWLAPGNLTVVASPGCGEALEVLEDSQLWMRVRTEAGTVGYVPRSAVADSLDTATKAQQDVPIAVSAPSAESASITSLGASLEIGFGRTQKGILTFVFPRLRCAVGKIIL